MSAQRAASGAVPGLLTGSPRLKYQVVCLLAMASTMVVAATWWKTETETETDNAETVVAATWRKTGTEPDTAGTAEMEA